MIELLSFSIRQLAGKWRVALILLLTALTVGLAVLVSVLSDADCFVIRAVKAGPALQGEMAEALPFTLSYDGY